MLIISPFIMLSISCILFLVLIVIIYRQQFISDRFNKVTKSQIEVQELFINEIQASQITLKKQVDDLNDCLNSQRLEDEQVSRQLEHRIKVIQKDSGDQKKLFEQFQNQQPQDKLYSRAFKLVELGAEIDEVVRECDIPLAEAEMLISVHRNKTTSS